MAETEVESILREIRERVLSQAQAGRDTTRSAAATNRGNGAGDATHLTRPNETEALAAESLALIQSYLTTTARTWDRLPPLVSNRSGVSARLELWLKRRLRAATRWFTWEQVNFNAAVHHALRDLLPVLLAYEQELSKLRAEIAGLRPEIDALETRLRAEISAEATARRVEFAQHATRAEMNARLAEVVSELRERDGQLQDQQRVCFKQLSLEASEAAVLEDRARRKTEALLLELSRRLEGLENR
jgi:hypothetical protein